MPLATESSAPGTRRYSSTHAFTRINEVGIAQPVIKNSSPRDYESIGVNKRSNVFSLRGRASVRGNIILLGGLHVTCGATNDWRWLTLHTRCFGVQERGGKFFSACFELDQKRTHFEGFLTRWFIREDFITFTTHSFLYFASNGIKSNPL